MALVEGNLKFNYNNIVTTRDVIISNKEVMVTEFENYKKKLVDLNGAWQGDAFGVSEAEFMLHIEKFNGFVQQVEQFIQDLNYAEQTELSEEKRASAGYGDY